MSSMLRSFRLPLLLAGALAAALLGAPAAHATITEIGPKPGTPGTPQCPAECIAVTKTTGYQAKIGPDRGLYAVPRDGRIVAWTLQLGKPGKKQTAFFDKNFGGPASAGIAVLRPGKRLFSRTVALSPIVPLQPWFGQTVQFPLETSIPVRKGQVIALNVPTWAPALAANLGGDTSWRASRKEACRDTATTQLDTTQQLNEVEQYRCLYRTARLTYSATLISTP